jgi:hypothetical protein
MGDASGLYDQFGIDPGYNDPGSYGERDSHFGDGRYPPDWAARRNAVWWLQDHECARCGRPKDAAGGYAVHHVRHLDDGGRNHLGNLAGLCVDCHALMHPDLDWMDGDPARAPLFPSPDAGAEVAVVRRPADGDEVPAGLETDLRRLAALDDPDDNEHAVTGAAVPTGSAVARRAATDIAGLLAEHGHVARNAAHHAVRVEPTYPGVRGLVARYDPPTSVYTDAELAELDGWQGGTGGHERSLYCTPDATWARVDLRDGRGGTVTSAVEFEGDAGEVTVTPTVAPPPVGTAPAAYLRGTLGYLARTVPLRGVLPALAVLSLAPETVPLSGVTAVAVLTLVLGLLLTLPTVAARALDDVPEGLDDPPATPETTTARIDADARTAD